MVRALILAVLTLAAVPSAASAQLYMSGAGGVYANLEGDGLMGRFALGAEPLDWLKVEGSVSAIGLDDNCCTVAADGTGWITVLSLGPVKVGGGGGFGVLTYVDADDADVSEVSEYNWVPYALGGVEAEFELTRHFAFTSRAELGLGEIRGYAGVRLGF